jgi:RNA polymerase sigma factor for flagellar operon FliA
MSAAKSRLKNAHGETGVTAAAQPGRPRRSRPERDELVERFLPLVRHVAGRLPVAMPAGFDREDLHSAGVLGLLHAATTWDPTVGTSFKTFAYTAIRGAMLDELRRLDPLPRPRRDRLRAMRKAGEELRRTLGRDAAIEEIAARIGADVEDLLVDLEMLRITRVISLDHPPSASGDGPIEPATDRDDPSRDAEQRDLLDALTSAIAELPEIDRRVMVLYHHDGLYLKEIGILLGVSESRVCQILARAQGRVRRLIRDDADDR